MLATCARALRVTRPPGAGGWVPRRAVSGVPELFDEHVKSLQRDRAAEHASDPDPLQDEVAERLLDRLLDVKRRFNDALVVGGAGPRVVERLRDFGVERITYVDSSRRMLETAARPYSRNGDVVRWGDDAGEREVREGGAGEGGEPSTSGRVPGSAVPDGPPFPSPPGADVDSPGERSLTLLRWSPDAQVMPVRPESFDLVVSCLGLHFLNDVESAIAQCRFALMMDGLFLGALLGGDTLAELRATCMAASQERLGGVSPRVSPLARVRDAGNLLTAAGLALPTVDVDDLEVGYPDVPSLVRHLRAMGEQGARGSGAPGGPLPRDLALAAAAAYPALWGTAAEGGGPGSSDPYLSATYQVIYLAGWAPHPSQKRAARRGSGTVSFEQLRDGMARGTGSSSPPIP